MNAVFWITGSDKKSKSYQVYDGGQISSEEEKGINHIRHNIYYSAYRSDTAYFVSDCMGGRSYTVASDTMVSQQ